MKRIAYLTLGVVLALGVSGAAAQGIESFMGSVKAVSGSSITVERGTLSGTFSIDPKTHVAATGSTAKTKANVAAGKPGLTVPDVVKVGDQVTIKFRETGGKMLATDIQVRTPAPGAAR